MLTLGVVALGGRADSKMERVSLKEAKSSRSQISNSVIDALRPNYG